MSTDEDWQAWGERDPYFGVLAQERFRRAQLTPQALEAFFQIGRQEFAEILAECRAHVGEFSLERTLDFGCGAGRLLIPLAEVSGLCVGIDVSDAMRVEAARNCANFGRANVQLARSLEELGAAAAQFSFIHSYIVLQHIAPRRGLKIIAALLARLAPGGAAALHLTFARSKYGATLGRPPHLRRISRQLGQPWRRFVHRVRGHDPRMQMNAYDMNRVLFLLHQHGVRCGGFRFTDHAGHLGVLLFVKRA
jgi:SAM-dependent methyltransferase